MGVILAGWMQVSFTFQDIHSLTSNNCHQCHLSYLFCRCIFNILSQNAVLFVWMMP